MGIRLAQALLKLGLDHPVTQRKLAAHARYRRRQDKQPKPSRVPARRHTAQVRIASLHDANWAKHAQEWLMHWAENMGARPQRFVLLHRWRLPRTSPWAKGRSLYTLNN